MASSVSISMVLPLTSANLNKQSQPSSGSFFKPLNIRQQKRILITKAVSKTKVGIEASLKEKVVIALTTASLTASMVIPEVAHAAESDLSPTLQNFLLSIFVGGVVLGALFGAVIGVSNFDPVKRT